MGLLVDGKWHDRWYDTGKRGGRFVRARCAVPQLGHGRRQRPGRSGEGGFAAEPGRYHLYVSLACPWAHRTLIFRKLKGLEKADRRLGRALADGRAGLDLRSRRRVPPATRSTAAATCTRSTPAPSPATPAGSPCRCCGTSSARTIVNNEFVRDHPDAELGLRRRRRRAGRLLPGGAAGRDRRGQRARLRHGQQRRLQGRLRHHAGGLRGGGGRAVRDAGLARGAARPTAATSPASGSPRPTGACSRRWCASTRSIVGHFKCNLRRLVDYPNLWAYTRELYQWPGVAETVELRPHQAPLLRAATATINPTGIVPAGPLLDFAAPVDRRAPVPVEAPASS